MTRKSKIQIAVAVLVVSTIALAFWAREEEEAVNVTCAGVSVSHSNRISFTITNSSSNTVRYYVCAQVGHRGNLIKSNDIVWPNQQDLAAQGIKTFELSGIPGKRWTVAVKYTRLSAPSFASRMRDKLGALADKNHSPRVAKWIRPKVRERTALGPEMLGNNLAPPEQK